MNIIDISRPLLTSDVYPGDPDTRLETIKSIAGGDICNLSAYYACAHTGTHADAPSHFLEGGDTIDKVNIYRYIGSCTVIEVPSGIITADYVERFFPRRCKRLLIKGNAHSFFMESAAYEAADTGICLIGTDASSIGKGDDQIKPHKAFLQNNIAVLENLDLSSVEPGNYYLIALPVKLGAVEAAPVRAVLIDDYILWNKM